MQTILIDLVKWVHLTMALCLTGAIIVSYMCVSFSRFITSNEIVSTPIITPLSIKLDKIAIACCLLQLITGAFLVFPKGFNFATPWISAAFTGITAIIILLLINIKMKRHNATRFFHLNYGVILLLIVIIIHDAVMKHTIWGA